MDKIKIVSFGDLHFGNPRMDAHQLYLKINKYIYPELENAHIVFITGDLYDQLLTVNSKAHRAASMLINDLINFSIKTGLQVRILHGTYTHDRDQLSIFEELLPKKARLKTINKIECEEITGLRSAEGPISGSLRVAYLPDNLQYKLSDDVITQLKSTMTLSGWSTVDALVGHGTFAHTIPPDSGHRPPCLYSQSQFATIVPTGPIIMGHIHSPGKYKNVYYCGSFDRMSHGEEEAKGFYVFTKEGSGTDGWRARFVKNASSNIFISISPNGRETEDIVDDYIKQVEVLFPTGKGNVRALHASTEIRAILQKVTLQKYPFLSFTSKMIGERAVQRIQVDDITLDIFDDVKPDIHNLGGLVYQYLEENELLETLTKEEIIGKVNALLGIQVPYAT